MPRRRFGAFLAPHHPVGEHPMLQFRRDLDLVELLDKLGYDEFWCGEHHSSGWEMIASPEMFLAARESAPGASNWRPASCRCPTSSIQRRPTHGSARSHDGWTCDLRLGTRRTGSGRAHARRRSDGAA